MRKGTTTEKAYKAHREYNYKFQEKKQYEKNMAAESSNNYKKMISQNVYKKGN